MKRSKKIYILLGVLVAACIATISIRRIEEHKEKIRNSDEIIMTVPVDTVKTLSWKNETTSLSFHKDEKWIYDEDEAFPADEEKINELLKLFEEFGASFIIEEVEDYGQYGLDDPKCTIKFSTEEQSYEVKVGDFSAMDYERYVSIGDGNVYLVKKDPMNYFDAELSDMIDHDETPKFDNVSEIKFAGAENYSITYEEDSNDSYNDEDVYFTERDGRKLPLDTSGVDGYLKNISSLKLTDYVTYNATDEELQKYGLDTPELTVTVKYTSEDEEGEKLTESFVLNISRDPEEKKKAEEAAEKAAKKSDEKENGNSGEDEKEEKITAYARVGESKIVYKITSDGYKKLMAASYNDLRHMECFYADFEDITGFDISLEGSDYSITTGKKDDEITYYYNGEELEIDDFRNAFENLKADSFTDEQPSKKEEISLTVHLENDKFPEIRIELYRYDGTHCLAVINGEPVSLIKRSGVVDLIEAVNAIVLN